MTSPGRRPARATSVESAAASARSNESGAVPAPSTATTEAPDKRGVLGTVCSTQFIASVVLGQVLSICIVVATINVARLSQDGAAVPALQCLFVFIALGLIFTTLSMVKRGVAAFVGALVRFSGLYLVLATVDMLGNVLVIKSFAHTSVLSVILLDTWAIPVVMLLSSLFLRVMYRWNHYAGVALGIGGMVALFATDAQRLYNGDTREPVWGDVLCILGATCYGVSNVLQETMAKKRSSTEVAAMMGIFGTGVALVQLLAFERHELKLLGGMENGQLATLSLYVGAMVLFYALAPVLLRLSSAAFFNVSLLTSDVYSSLIAVAWLGEAAHPLYPAVFIAVATGIALFNACPPRTRAQSLFQQLRRGRPRDLERDPILGPLDGEVPRVIVHSATPVEPVRSSSLVYQGAA